MKETIVLALAWIVPSLMLLLFIPRNKIREAMVIFLFKQILTWSLGLIVVEMRLIEYPFRLFPYASRTSFTFEFFVYPAVCAVFNITYPRHATYFKQFLYYSYFCSGITIIEVLAEKYTNIIKYLHWNWFVTWSTLFITFYISRKFYLWFFKPNSAQSN